MRGSSLVRAGCPLQSFYPVDANSSSGRRLAFLTVDENAATGFSRAQSREVLEPLVYLSGYEENPALKSDWEQILNRHPKRILCAHADEQRL